MSNAKCNHCGGEIAVRNPSGNCDHLYWPNMLTDEAKRANGYVKVVVEKWELASDVASELNRKEFEINGPDRW